MREKSIVRQLHRVASLNDVDLNTVRKLYPDKILYETSGQLKEVSEVKTKKGQWSIHFRRDSPVGQFCAVYYQKDKICGIIKGELFEESALEQTIDVLTKNVLERSGVSRSSWDADRMSTIGCGIGAIVGLAAPALLIFFRAADLIPFVTPVTGVSGAAGGALFARYFGQRNEQAVNSKLPAEAKHYRYGQDAITELIREDERGSVNLSPVGQRYKTLIDAGVDIPRQRFIITDERMASDPRPKKWLTEQYGEENALKIVNTYLKMEGGIRDKQN